MDRTQQVVETTKNWVETVVVGLNFCPFAKREVQRNSIRYSITRGEKSIVLNAFLEEIRYLDEQSSIETTLLIIEQGFESFDDYLLLLDYAQVLINQSGYSGVYQLASFHPNYLFEDESEDSPSHYTNRAPYPVIHILRESSLDRVASENNVKIPEINIEKSVALGKAYLQTLLVQCQAETKKPL